MKTRKGSWVSPKIAGIESRANSRSVDPIANMTISIGVTMRRPSTRTNERAPWNSGVTGSTRRT